MARLNSFDKLVLLKKVLEQGNSVAAVCRQAGISRKTFYSWLKKFKRNKKSRKLALISRNPKGRTQWKSLDYKKEQQILSLVHQNPKLSCHKLHKVLSQKGSVIGHHGVQNVLIRYGLNRFGKRLEFAKKPFYKKLDKFERAVIINQILAKKDTVKSICQQFGVSRKLVYKWLSRYKQNFKVEALTDKIRKSTKHWRWISEEKAQKILNLVLAHPEWSAHKLYAFLPKVENKPIIGHHGVQNVLLRYGLNTYQKRLAWIETQKPVFVPKAAPAIFTQPPKYLRFIISPFATIPKFVVSGFELISSLSRSVYGVPVVGGLIAGAIFGLYEYFVLLSTAPPQTRIGLVFSTIALFFGLVFFLYSLKYYLSAILVLLIPGTKRQGQKPGLIANLEEVKLETKPFVSIHIPLYNEKNVADRILAATLNLDYPKDKFEIIIVDDSTDETTEIVRRFESNDNPIIKLIHRDTRQGFKGGALREALAASDPKAEYVLVFDADFIPFPETVEQFLKYFQLVSDTGSEKGRIAAIQGYQWHVLNKSENWITRGVRAEYAGSYVVERSATEIYSGLKMIAGSVYCIKRNILDKFGWGTSLTEDFQLTLRLYAQGYKVIYTPYIQTPSECVSTVRRLIRQRMRWAEGHTFNIKKMLIPLLFGKGNPQLNLVNNHEILNPKSEILNNGLTFKEKLEFAYLAPYYLQAAFFILGTISWFISEAVFHTRLPFWTSAFGWSLVFTNFLSLPLINSLGLFLEEAERKDYFGILSFVVLSYIVTPFQAYAAVKGLLEKQEGPWFRTPKTGIITDVISRVRLGYWWRRFLPWGSPAPAATTPISTDLNRLAPIISFNQPLISNNPHRISAHQRFLSKSILAILLVITLMAGQLSFFIPQTLATNPTDTKWNLRDQNVGNSQFGVAIYSVDDPNTAGNDPRNNNKISYYDATNGDLKFIDCGADQAFPSSCSFLTITTVDSTGDVGQYSSIFCPTDNDCKISYYDVTNGDLIFRDCDDATCSTGTRTTVDSTGDVGQYSSIFCQTATDCRISYYDVTNGDLKFADCDNATCSTQATGSPTTVDSTDNVGQYSSVSCESAPLCQVAYYDVTNTALKFLNCTDGADAGSSPCNDATERTINILDGNTGCTLTLGSGCSTTADRGQFASVRNGNNTCPGASGVDCKIAYYDATNGDLFFGDCDDANCSAGTATNVDSTNDVGKYASIWCEGAANCRISYYDVTDGDLEFRACSNSTCSTNTTATVDSTGDVGQYTSNSCEGDTQDCSVSYYDVTNGDLKFTNCDGSSCSQQTSKITVDGNKIINATLGAVTTTKTFGTSAGQTYTLVSDTEYPTGGNDGSLGTGTYTLHLHFTNNITAGTLTWHYHVGYCTIRQADNCGTKTVHVTSADQNFTSATTSPQDPAVTAGSALTIPLPQESKWLYIELHATAVATGTISVRMNNTDANTADSNISVPALTVPEFIGFLIPFAPFLPKAVRKVKDKFRRLKKIKKVWKPFDG